MNQTIGSLRVALGLDSAEFSAGLKQVQGTIDRFAGRMRTIGAAISAVGAGITLAVRGQLDAADEMGKAASRFGVPVEELSTLKYAADLSGVSMEQLGTALSALSRNMVKSEKRFSELGISIRDAKGQMRPTGDVLADIADLMQTLPDGAEKTALAMQLLGKSGAALIPLLNEGGAAIRAYQDEARAMGLEISAATAESAAQFNDNLFRLGATMTGFGSIVAANLAPILAQASKLVVALARAFQNLSPETQRFLSVLAGVTVVLGPALIELSMMLPALKLLLSAVGLLTGPLGLLAAAITGIVIAAGGVRPALDAVSMALTGMPWEEQLAAWRKFGDDLKLIWEEWPTAMKVIADRLSEELTGMPWEEQLAAWRKFGDDLKLIWDNWPIALRIVADRFAAHVAPGLQSLANAMQAGAQKAYDWLVAKFGEIWDYLAGLPAQWYQSGVDMVQGLIDGFSAKWAEFKAMIFSADAEAKQTFMEDWMIQSQSRVTMGYGQNIAAGLAIGIEQGVSGVTAAVGKLTEAGVSQMESMSEKMQGLADGLAQGLTGIFEKLVSGARITLQDIGQIVSQIANTLFIQPFMSGLQSGLKGLFGGFAGGFASGGFIPPGQWGITGEAGPEIVSGGRSGVTVTPMRQAGGVTQVFNITAPDPNAFRYSQRQIARRARSALGTM